MWKRIATIVLSVVLFSSLNAGYTFKNGWFVNTNEIATMSAEEHFAAGASAYERGDWCEAASQFTIVIINYPNSTYAQDARFFMGISYYWIEEYDFANDAFSDYLKCTNNPRYFQDAVLYKFYIAEQFRCGAKRRFFGTKQLPKWACGKDSALAVYDEVIAAMPSNEIAAKALFSKACLLWELKDFRCAVESFQLIVRRFPKHELAPESYLMINRVYLQQAFLEFQNPDILAFAQINLKRFKQDFPGEERIVEAEEDVQCIKEIYALGLFETGEFYERICKPRAAMIYFFSAVHQFPDTEVARIAGQHLSCLDPSFDFDLYVASQQQQAQIEAGTVKDVPGTEDEEDAGEEFDFDDL